MDAALDSLLCQNYPLLFRDRHASMQETAMCWGLECGNGWYELIDALCAQIDRHLQACFDEGDRFNVKVVQVKEKFGTLRFYAAGEDDFISGLIWMAEALSGILCETCGRHGRVVSLNKYTVGCRCPDHGGQLFASEAPPNARIDARHGLPFDLHALPDASPDSVQARHRILAPVPLLSASIDRFIAAYERFPALAFLLQAVLARLVQDALMNRDPDLAIGIEEEAGRPVLSWLRKTPPSFTDGKLVMAQAIIDRCQTNQGRWRETLAELTGSGGSTG